MVTYSKETNKTTTTTIMNLAASFEVMNASYYKPNPYNGGVASRIPT